MLTTELPIIGRDKNNQEVRLSVNIYITSPSSVDLQAIRVNDDQKRLFMRPGSADGLYIYGVYSDGIERRVDASSLGTTYQSSDSKVATVDSEGLVKAIAPGKAIITVKNGNKNLQVEVFVKAK